MEVTGIALQGLQQAEAHFEKAAGHLSSLGAVLRVGPADDSVDLSAAAVDLLASRAEFAANLRTVKAAGDIERDAIDLLA